MSKTRSLVSWDRPIDTSIGWHPPLHSLWHSRSTVCSQRWGKMGCSSSNSTVTRTDALHRWFHSMWRNCTSKMALSRKNLSYNSYLMRKLATIRNCMNKTGRTRSNTPKKSIQYVLAFTMSYRFWLFHWLIRRLRFTKSNKMVLNYLSSKVIHSWQSSLFLACTWNNTLSMEGAYCV